MATLEKAIALAAVAHSGQKDKGGAPYILHPIRVMLRLEGDADRIVAVLHDVVEDSDITLDALAAEGFSPEILRAIDALTKQPGETRLQAAARAAKNEIARRVKLADNAENCDLTRIANPTERDMARLHEYEEVRDFLLSTSH